MRFGIGQSAPRVEDRRLTTGRGRYTDDIALPGQAFAVLLRSPHPNAGIRAIDTTHARQMPGVLDVVTGAEVRAAGLGPLPTMASTLPLARADGPAYLPEWWPLAPERVRFVGDGVVMVVAESRAAAQDAAEHVEVDYATDAAITDLRASADGHAPAVWPECADNTCFEFRIGDEEAVARAFERAAHRVSATVPVSRICAAPMEPLAAVATYDALDDRYTLYSGTQMPAMMRQAIAARVLHVPESRLRIISPDMGGSFGLRSSAFPELALTLWASKRLGRPVKYVGQRSEMIASIDQARDMHLEVELALDADGHFLAVRLDGLAALGAYVTQFGPFPGFGNLGGLAGPYRTPHICARVRGMFVHTAPTSPYRGAGRPEASLAIETVVDRAATALGIDRVALRRRNLIPSSAMPFQTGLTYRYDCGDFEATMDRALAAADAAGFESRRAAARARGRLRGLGIAYTVEQSAGMLDEGAEIRLDPGGDATVHMATHSHGQGHETVFRQIVSDRLGLDLERIRYVQGDTDHAPYGLGTGGSRVLSLGGGAISLALDRIVAKGREIAAHHLEAAVEDVEHTGGDFVVAGTDRRVSLDDVARFAHHPALRGPVEGGLRAEATFVPEGPNFPNGCHVCEVEIDPETGASAVIGYWAVMDVGTVMNPRLLAGQVQGGVVQGLGQIVLEHMIWDPESGQPVTGSFMDYALPRADEAPACELSFNPVPTALNPLGVKGAGEAGTVGALPCVASAIHDALLPAGVEAIAMPATAHRIWQALQRARAAGAG